MNRSLTKEEEEAAAECAMIEGDRLEDCEKQLLKQAILDYYNSCNCEKYPSDVAAALDADPKLVFDLTEELVTEGKLK